MSFITPVALVLLVVVPLLVGAHLWYDRHRTARAAAWTSPALLPNMATAPGSWRRHLPFALLLLGLTFLLVGFARPKATETVKKQDATVVIVLDVSGSMAAKDASPTRLGAARAAALRYIAALPHGYRVALISFSDQATVLVPPTSNLDHVRTVLGQLHTGPQGTALARAVARGVTLAKQVRAGSKGKRPPAVLVLFSDGGQTEGMVTPAQAAAYAKGNKVPVTAVSVGTQDGVVEQPLKGGYEERFQVPVQPAVLHALATGSGGTFVSGASNVDPKRTFAELGSRVGHERKSVEITSAAAGGGLVFMLAGALLSGIWFRRLV